MLEAFKYCSNEFEKISGQLTNDENRYVVELLN